MQKLVYVVCFIMLSMIFSVSGYTLERHLLLFAPLVEGNQTVVLEVLSTGQIIDTGQRLNTGYGTHYPGVSPDQQNILIPAANTTWQYRILPTGLVSRVSTYEFLGGNEWRAAYHPNGKMAITSYRIFRVKPDETLEFANTYSGAGFLWISPKGNILISHGASGGTASGILVFHIDTVNFTITTSQWIFINGSANDAVYTPDGSQLLVAKYPSGANFESVDIFTVAPDGTVDTTAQHLGITWGVDNIEISVDGQFAYISVRNTSGFIATIARTSTGQWVDTGKRVTGLNNPWEIKLTPVYNLLLLQTFNEFSERILSTYFVNSDGSLTPTGYSFPITQTFGNDDFLTNIFAYPPGVTDVEQKQWEVYQ